MRALTVRQPYAHAIIHGIRGRRKTVELRSWQPWPSVHGCRIAIHAAKAPDMAACLELGMDPSMLALGAIIGTAEVAGCVDFTVEGKRIVYLARCAELVDAATPTHALGPVVRRQRGTPAGRIVANGPFGWVLAAPIPRTPFFCAGALGLWRPPEEFHRTPAY